MFGLDRRLVGFDFADELSHPEPVTHNDMPLGEGAFLHGVARLGHHDGDNRGDCPSGGRFHGDDHWWMMTEFAHLRGKIEQNKQ
jgi:hypothetical protein